MAKGKSNREIARQLFGSLKTVRNHISNILLKLQVADRAQAVIRAREAGMGRGWGGDEERRRRVDLSVRTPLQVPGGPRGRALATEVLEVALV